MLAQRYEHSVGRVETITKAHCYTRTCHLAANACVTFAAKGFPVMEIEGGFAAWKEYELDIEQEPENRWKKNG